MCEVHTFGTKAAYKRTLIELIEVVLEPRFLCMAEFVFMTTILACSFSYLWERRRRGDSPDTKPFVCGFIASLCGGREMVALRANTRRTRM